MTEIRELSMRNIGAIKQLFSGVFSGEPWNDDWSNDIQLHSYIAELIGNDSSLTFGLYVNGGLVGLSMGNIRHWWQGVEYNIAELCIKTDMQGNGFGTEFVKLIEESVRSRGVTRIFLQTQRHAPAYDFYCKNGFGEIENHVSLLKTLQEIPV